MGHPMDKDVKKLWIDALRSGKYKQGKNALRTEDKFCCLGVLCDISNKYLWTQAGKDSTFFRYANEMSSPPEKVFSWANLDRGSLVVSLLVRFNDCQGVSFNGIADYIEENL